MKLYFAKCKTVNNLTHAGTGKTVIAAFDYRNFRKKHPVEACRLLFVAHREEILKQSRDTFQGVLRDFIIVDDATCSILIQENGFETGQIAA